MKRIISTYIFLGFFYAIMAQISTGELPVSFRQENKRLLTERRVEKKMLPAINREQLRREDTIDKENGRPPRFGYSHPVNYDLDNSGTWTTLPDGGLLWQLVLDCPGALSINLLYDKFWLPEGAKLFIYGEDNQEQVLGAFTSKNNKGHKNDIQGFATGLVYGDQITLEYYLPNNVKEIGVISIAYVVHGYRNIRLYGYSERNEKDDDLDDCFINIDCPEGADWQNEKKAVALILVNGNRWCTGSLINTTANDNRPLLLTADHCLGGWVNTVKHDATVNFNLNHWSFWWNYEAPECSDVPDPSIWSYSTTGATVVANNPESDFALLKLKEDPIDKAGVTPYYLGWDRSVNIDTGGVGIHHPEGKTKKISVENDTIVNFPLTICWKSDHTGCIGDISPENTHWSVNFDNGAVRDGSFGSPLLNQDRRVIGQAHGGHGDCPPDIVSYYGRFDVSWDGAIPERRLKDWLDPEGTDAITLDGCEGGNINLTNRTISDTLEIEGRMLYMDNIVITPNAHIEATVNRAQLTNVIAPQVGSRVYITTTADFINNCDAEVNNQVTLLQSRAAITYDEPAIAAETIEANLSAQLYQNHPNPFTGQTVIGYYLPETSGPAWIRVINTGGVTVKTVDIVGSGYGNVSLEANSLPPGVYFYSLLIDGRIIDSKRMMVK